MLKKRSCPSLQFLAAAANSTAEADASMSFRSTPAYKGGRNQWRNRGFSYSRPYGTVNDQFVTGNSDGNRDLKPNYNSQPPPFQTRPNFDPSSTNFYHNQPFWPPGQPPPPNFIQNQQFRPPQFNQNKQFRPQGQRRPHLNHNQQYRPAGQPSTRSGQFRLQQQSRPRPSKALEYRNWEYAKPGPPPSCERFKVLSYNILADYLAINHRSKLYYHIPLHILDWEFRKKNLMFELGLWSADILCLQEVDKFRDLEEELMARGYSGIWKMRTGEPTDGCAIFWRSSRFKLLHEESIEFRKLGLRDNVAQICVLELVNENNSSGSALLASPEGHNKVVICNIHVLYNPKRGDIKLGQVRVFLDRAYATSKLWDDAPVVLCGDFNSTPKSALYNFIAEQKLNVSEQPRDKISGQDSATRQRKPFSPNVRAQSADYSTQSTSTDDKGRRQDESPLGIQEDGTPSVSGSAQPQSTTVMPNNESVSSFTERVHENKNTALQPELKKEIDYKEDVSKDEIQLSLQLEASRMTEMPGGPNNGDCSNIGMQSREETRLTSNESCASSLQAESSAVQTRYASTLNTDVTLAEPMNLTPCSESVEAFPSESLLSDSVTNDKDSLSMKEFGLSFIATNEKMKVDETVTEASQNELFQATEDGFVDEDSTTFLSELHGADRSGFVDDIGSKEQSPEAADYLDDFSANGREPFGMERPYQSAWTPEEIEAATGSSESAIMEHPLKLRSTYPEVEDFSGTRDSNGEPKVTSYHRDFQGTVDYIWRSEGLQTVRALAPLRMQAMQWTPGFPTRKWGSDHIALVTELAFNKNSNDQNAEAQ